MTATDSERQIHIRTCPLCECMCGLQVHVEKQEVKLIRADRDDVFSKGFICPKGTTLGHMYHDPDRLRRPLVKRDGQHVEVSWDEAFAECERLINEVKDRHGPEAFTYYIGNPTAHNFSLGRYVGLFTTMSGIEMGYSAGTVDQWPKNVSCALMYGNPWLIPAPDLPNTTYFVCMGGNPQASGGSLLAHADVLGEMDNIREAGGKCVVIDPRRTGTADHADEWVPIVPGTDALYLLAMLNVLYAEDLVDFGRMADHVVGAERLAALVTEFTPEAVEATTKVPADDIRRLAREFASADRAIMYGRIGTCNQEFGTLASWLTDVVNIVTGNFDEPGGLMFGKPVARPVNRIPNEDRENVQFGRWTSRVRGAPEVLGQVPVSCLAEEIDTPGEGQIRGLVCIAGNPSISAPDAARMDAAFAELECMISIDNWLNETSRHAHVVLPGQQALETAHYDELLSAWATRSFANYSPPVFDPDPDHPGEWQILIRLGALMAGMSNDDVDIDAIDDGWFAGLCQAHGVDPEKAAPFYGNGDGGPERILDLTLRAGPWGDQYGDDPDGLTLEKLKQEPHGIDFGPMPPQVPEVLQTTDQKVHVAPGYIVDDLARLRERIGRPDEGLLLVSRRHLRSNNSWMHNVKVLVKGKDRCTLLINPVDAEANGVVDGGVARVSSENGSLEVPVEVSDEMMAGIVCLPHGWGHDKEGTRLSVAREHAGVNNNVLAIPTFVDEISGNQAVNGIPVEVQPV